MTDLTKIQFEPNVQLVHSIEELTKILYSTNGIILYVFSPGCGACVARLPRFIEHARKVKDKSSIQGHLFALNAKELFRTEQNSQFLAASVLQTLLQKMLKNTNFRLEHWPTILTISKHGKLNEWADSNEPDFSPISLPYIVEQLSHQ